MDRRFRWLALVLAGALAGAAHAQALTGTLKKIKDTGVVSLGIRESSVPFSYSDNSRTTSATRATSRRASSTR